MNTPTPTPQPLISARELLAAQPMQPPQWLLLDCRFDLTDVGAGARAYQAGHLPGAHYLHLDADMSGPKRPGAGRHPLPDRLGLAARLAGLGMGSRTRVVAYDGQGGMYAARLWWLLQWLGHDQVQVLDGGLQAWQAEGGSLSTDAPPTAAPSTWAAGASLVPQVDYASLRAGLGQPGPLVVDARSPDRFRGENETLDPVGGHIPGAVNRFFRDNLGADGRFKPPAQLQAEWQAVADGRPAAQLVMQCGSGVTACHNLLALSVAGLPGASLYPGSWSEWCAQPDTVVATG